MCRNSIRKGVNGKIGGTEVTAGQEANSRSRPTRKLQVCEEGTDKWD